MDFSRLTSAMDIERLQASRVAIIGTGGSTDYIVNLARSGVASFVLFDIDRVDASNLARQGHNADAVGQPKVDAAARRIRAVNPEAQVECHTEDFRKYGDDEAKIVFGDIDLLILATDSFWAQARGNEIALLTRTKALFIGGYAGGMGGEIVFWRPGLPACFRCLLEARYFKQWMAAAMHGGIPLDPASDGTTIFDVSFLDAIAGHLALGLLTSGADNRFGRLIEELGDRNFIQVALSPDFNVNGVNVIRSKLGVPAENDALFAWNAISIRDPDGGMKYCPDCERYLGKVFADANKQ